MFRSARLAAAVVLAIVGSFFAVPAAHAATLPAPPTFVDAGPGNARAEVVWSNSGNDGGSPVTSYTVTAYLGGALFKTVTVAAPEGGCSAPPGWCSATVTGLTNGTAYTFKVASTNAVGTGPARSAPWAVTPRTVPGAPTGVTANPGNGQATVNWNAPLDNGKSAITSYTITAYSGGNILKTVEATGTSVPVTGLVNGTAYTFTVAANNIAGTGPASSASAPVTPRTVAGPPENLTVVSVGDGQVGLVWDSPTSDGGASVSSFTVTVRSGDTLVTNVTAWVPTALITGLINGVAHTFEVTATNAAGAGPGVATGPVTPRTIPGAPTGVVASPGDGQASV